MLFFLPEFYQASYIYIYIGDSTWFCLSSTGTTHSWHNITCKVSYGENILIPKLSTQKNICFWSSDKWLPGLCHYFLLLIKFKVGIKLCPGEILLWKMFWNQFHFYGVSNIRDLIKAHCILLEIWLWEVPWQGSALRQQDWDRWLIHSGDRNMAGGRGVW